jgi:hypothetical protein
MLDVNALKGILKSDLIALFNDCKSGDGLTEEVYADRMAEILAQVIPYIVDNAEVNPGIDVTGGTQTGGSLVGAKTIAKGKLS